MRDCLVYAFRIREGFYVLVTKIPGAKLVNAIVTSAQRTDGGAKFTVVYQETGFLSKRRIFTVVYDWADKDGVKTPKPQVRDKVILNVNRKGDVVASEPAE
jgi:hypothetical protein